MKIATFNANSIRARMDIIKKWLLSSQCDVLCVQETKVQDKDFPVSAFSEIGYRAYFKGQKSYNGVAILVKEGADVLIEDVGFGLGDGEDSEEDMARSISCRLFLNSGLNRQKAGSIRLINIYAPQGREVGSEYFEKKLKWYARLCKKIDAIIGNGRGGDAKDNRAKKDIEEVLLTGDFNIAPSSIDVYAPEKKLDHVCYHESVRLAFKRLLSIGLYDLFRRFNSDGGQYTFFDYRLRGALKRGLGWRIDHMLVSKGLLKYATACYIDIEPRLWQRPSDHTFLVGIFSYNKGLA